MLRDDKRVTVNGNTATMRAAHMADKQVADQVRMLTRNDLNHEMLCVIARDRIMYLSELVGEAREMLAQVGGAWPPSRPIQDAPRDGTYVLLKGPQGTGMCQWRGDPEPGGFGAWYYKASMVEFQNPGRFWDLPAG